MKIGGERSEGRLPTYVELYGDRDDCADESELFAPSSSCVTLSSSSPVTSSDVAVASMETLFLASVLASVGNRSPANSVYREGVFFIFAKETHSWELKRTCLVQIIKNNTTGEIHVVVERRSTGRHYADHPCTCTASFADIAGVLLTSYSACLHDHAFA